MAPSLEAASRKSATPSRISPCKTNNATSSPAFATAEGQKQAMKSFPEFVAEAAQHGTVNLAFEGGMYSLVNALERIVHVFCESGIAFGLVSGVAVNAHVLSVRRSRSFLTRDIDLLIHESDLSLLAHSAGKAGYIGRRIMGGYALVLPGQDLEEAVHILFVGKTPIQLSSPEPSASPGGKRNLRFDGARCARSRSHSDEAEFSS